MHNPKWLALETSTDILSLAVARGPQTWTHTGPGGALTQPVSATTATPIALT